METTAKSKIGHLVWLRDNTLEIFNRVFGKEKDCRYDKTQFDFSIEDACHKLRDVIYFRHHMGVYGDSNVSSAFSSELSNYIARAIDEKKNDIFNRAIELINKDIRSLIEALKAEKEEMEVMIKQIEANQ